MSAYLRPLLELTLARLREQFRQPEMIFWVFAFPVLLAMGLGLAFRNRPPEVVRVAVEAGAGAEELGARLEETPGFEVSVLPPEVAAERLRTGRVALVVVAGDSLTYRYDPGRSESRLARLATDDALQRALGRADARATADRAVTERGARYIDFLIPGLLGLNLMGTGMWGMGYAVVDARRRKLMKRLVASPMRRSQYLLSFVAARLTLLAPEVALLVGFGALVFDVPVRGSLAGLAVASVVGAMCFAGLGLLTACRAQPVEAVSGLMNLIQMPMWVLSGVFFSVANFPEAMQPFIAALPLTAVNDMLRGIMIEGASLTALAAPLGITAAWGAVSFAVALRLFRWL
ncbi:MAG: ABC transporter permease [Gemmatimonadetes bacterium]|nr:ABC transporter permease [Gemmatimonadota bacterium]